MMQALFRCDALYDAVPIGHGRHYKVSDENKSGVVCQDSCRHFSINAENCTDEDMPTIFARTVGTPIRLRDDLDRPLAAQLAVRAALHRRSRDARRRLRASGHPDGRAGPQHRHRRRDRSVVEARRRAERLGRPRALLQSYEDERRQIGVRNVRASGNATENGASARESHFRPWIREDSERGREVRELVGNIARARSREDDDHHRASSAAIATPTRRCCGRNRAKAPIPTTSSYVPTTWPGARLPHMWLNDGDALLDKFGPWYTVLRFGERVDTRGHRKRARRRRRAVRNARARRRANPPTRSTAGSMRFSSVPTCTSRGVEIRRRANRRRSSRRQPETVKAASHRRRPRPRVRCRR